MTQPYRTYNRVESGAIFSTQAFGHTCSAYCEGEIHAHVGYGSAGITEPDVREAVKKIGWPDPERIHFTNEDPRIRTVIGEPTAAPISQAYVIWLDHRKLRK